MSAGIALRVPVSGLMKVRMHLAPGAVLTVTFIRPPCGVVSVKEMKSRVKVPGGAAVGVAVGGVVVGDDVGALVACVVAGGVVAGAAQPIASARTTMLATIRLNTPVILTTSSSLVIMPFSNRF